MTPFEWIRTSRRGWLKLAGGALTGPALLKFASAQTTSDPERFFYFAVIADSHIIDEFYHGPESNQLDTESLAKSAERLTSARDFLNGFHPAIEQVFLVGDYFHNYPSLDYDFYFKNRTRVDNAKQISDGFRAPLHAGFGNHDYAVPKVSREFSHDLFKAKFGLPPFYAVEHKGWKFLHVNNFLGDTWNPASTTYNRNTGSLGETQLEWLEAELAQHKPTFVLVHYPLRSILDVEVADRGLKQLLAKHQDTVQRVISGHWHQWMDFGRTFGPPHLVMAATRYDANAYMLVEVDRKAMTHRWLNADLVHWATHYSEAWRG